MDPVDELRALVPHVVSDPDATQAYRFDEADLAAAGQPRAVVLATSTADVAATLRWASAHRIPVVPRGAGTGLSGGAAAVDGCVVLSLARMTAIRELDADNLLAVVEPGVLNADVTRAAERYGLFYPPDPSSFEISTIGGNVATNAGGLRCVKYGVTRDSVLGLEVVLADGRTVRTGGRTVKQVAGYDLTRLFVGSEGTLGVVTEATLRLRPRPATPPVTFVATFPTLAGAGAAVAGILRTGAAPSLLELLDNTSINLIEDHRRMDLDRSAAALLLGQSDGPTAADDVARMVAVCTRYDAADVVTTDDRAETDMLLAARRAHHGAVTAAGATLIDDVGVPPAKLPELLAGIEAVAADHGVRIATVGHAGDGNVHPTVIFPPDDPVARDQAVAAAEAVCHLAVRLGGTITGEHGVGSVKRDWLAAELDADTLAVHHAVKAALDPAGILNPGKAI
ncbi:MAG TPA: FAD-linked oxidase C-terminal domain-containing protein [Actinocatenispora sp.]